MPLPRSLRRAAAILALCAVAAFAIVAAGASSPENEAAATFAAAAPATAATFAAAAEEAPSSPSPSSSPSSSLEEAVDPTSAAIAAAAAAVDSATVDALLRIRAGVSPSEKKGGAAGPEVASDAAAEDAVASGPLPAPLPPSSLAAESGSSGSSSSLARESQDAYRSYKGLVPGSRFAQLAPPGAFPGSPPARAEAAPAPLSGKATLTAPGEAAGALLASLPPPSANAPAPSPSRGRGKGTKTPSPAAPPPSSGPKGDATETSKRIWKLQIDAAATRQPFEGWGTSLAWWALVVGSLAESVRNKVADLIFDASKGLGLEVVR